MNAPKGEKFGSNAYIVSGSIRLEQSTANGMISGVGFGVGVGEDSVGAGEGVELRVAVGVGVGIPGSCTHAASAITLRSVVARARVVRCVRMVTL